MSDKKKKTSKPGKTQDLEDQLTELDSKYRRALADYQNLTKQHQKERAEYLQYSNSQLIAQLLPLLDNLQQAQKHLNDQGLAMIISQFHQILTNEGIEEINPSEGDQFDAHLHEALDTVETENEAKSGQIAETFLVGYKYKDAHVLRHAKVKVYSLTEEQKNRET